MSPHHLPTRRTEISCAMQMIKLEHAEAEQPATRRPGSGAPAPPGQRGAVTSRGGLRPRVLTQRTIPRLNEICHTYSVSTASVTSAAKLQNESNHSAPPAREPVLCIPLTRSHSLPLPCPLLPPHPAWATRVSIINVFLAVSPAPSPLSPPFLPHNSPG